MRQRTVEVAELKPRPSENVHSKRERAILLATLGERAVAKQIERAGRRRSRPIEL